MLFVCTLDTIIIQNTADVKHAFTADDVHKIGPPGVLSGSHCLYSAMVCPVQYSRQSKPWQQKTPAKPILSGC